MQATYIKNDDSTYSFVASGLSATQLHDLVIATTGISKSSAVEETKSVVELDPILGISKGEAQRIVNYIASGMNNMYGSNRIADIKYVREQVGAPLKPAADFIRANFQYFRTSAGVARHVTAGSEYGG